jgi:hypothetical protein
MLLAVFFLVETRQTAARMIDAAGAPPPRT